jgi:hypothetical protein
MASVVHHDATASALFVRSVARYFSMLAATAI